MEVKNGKILCRYCTKEAVSEENEYQICNNCKEEYRDFKPFVNQRCDICKKFWGKYYYNKRHYCKDCQRIEINRKTNEFRDKFESQFEQTLDDPNKPEITLVYCCIPSYNCTRQMVEKTNYAMVIKKYCTVCREIIPRKSKYYSHRKVYSNGHTSNFSNNYCSKKCYSVNYDH